MRWVRQNRYYLALALALAAIGVLVFLLLVPDWFWHPLGTRGCLSTFKGNLLAIRDCKGYNWHSGIEGNLSLITLVVGVAVFWLKHNCYEHGCPKIGRVKGDDGHLRCKRHHKKTHPHYAQTTRPTGT